MIKFLRFFVGWVEFRFYGGFAEDFVNACYQSKINIHDLKRCGGEIFGACVASEYKKLHRAAYAVGGKVEITKKHGAVFELLKYKHRFGLAVGLVAFIAIINFLGGFVWNIETVGNNNITSDEIVSLLEKQNIKIGARWDDIKLTPAENMIMAVFDDCGWVSINKIGCTARVEISEAVPKPKIDSRAITNLVATKDGVIVKETVYHGWQIAKVGDGVAKGDLLVSGVYPKAEARANVFAHGSGEFIARVNEDINITVNRSQNTKIYTSTKNYREIKFFGITIPLYFSNSDKPSADIYDNASYIKLNGKEIPVGINKKTANSYTISTRNLSDRELNQMITGRLESKFKGDFADYEIVSKNISVQINSDNAVAHGTVVCLENIGEEVEIKVNEKSK